MKFPSFRRRNKAARLWKRRAGALGGSRLRGVEPLEQRQLLSVVPTLAPIDDVILQHGTPKYVVLDGFDGGGDALAFTVESTNSSLGMDIPEGNRSLRMTVRDFGAMEFELFEGRAPITTEHIIGLVEDGFYNTTVDQTMTFHRVVEDFVIQGGDPEGTGSGGSGETITDEFHEDLRHTMAGILSMANRGPGTGDSQFFITAIPTRWLDGDPAAPNQGGHTIFGFLTEGDDVREAIENVPTDLQNKPDDDVVIESMEIFPDTENGVLILTVPEGVTSGTAQVTVTADDGNDGTASQTFNVTIGNTPPVLNAMEDTIIVSGEEIDLGLFAPDADGDDATYSASVEGSAAVTAEVDGWTLTLAAAEGTTGAAEVTVTADDGNGGSDARTFNVTIANTPPVLAHLDNWVAQPSDTKIVTLSATDVDGDELDYTVDVGGDPILDWTLNGNELTLSVVEGVLGQASVTVTVEDGNGGSDQQTFYVAVGNAPPVLAHLDHWVALPNDTKTVTLSAIDLDGDELDYTVNVGGDPILDWTLDGTALTLSVFDGVDGQASVTVTVEDGNGGSDQQTFNVTINSRPVLAHLNNWVAQPGDTKTITLSATDLDGDELDYAVNLGGDRILAWTLDGTELALSVFDGAAGRASVTVTVEDGRGGSDEQTFYVGVGNSHPFLEPVADIHTTVDTPVTVEIVGVDLDGDGISYWGLDEPWNKDLKVVTGAVSGQMTITPLNGLIGVHTILVAVRSETLPPPGPVPQPPVWDVQYVPLMIHPPALTEVELLAVSDTGISDSDRLTKLNNGLQFRVSGPLMTGTELRVLADGVVIASKTVEQVDADRGWAEVTSDVALGDGDRVITALQSFGDYPVILPGRSETVDLVSGATPGLGIEIKAKAPEFRSAPIEMAYENVGYFYDVDTHDESTGLVTFSLTEAPAGMVIDDATGQIDWLPAAGDANAPNSVAILAADDAGNETFQTFTIDVAVGPTVDSWVYTNRPMDDGDFFGLIAGRTGKLTVEALFLHSQGDIDIELWKEGEDGAPKGTLVGSSSTSNADSDNERIDVNDAQVGDVYRVFVSGANPWVALAFTNLLVEVEGEAKGDDTLTVYGAANGVSTGNGLASYGDDRFEITVGPPHEVIVHYEWSDGFFLHSHDVVYGAGQIGAGQIGAGVTTIVIDADQGNDTVAITGTAADGIIEMRPGEGSLNETGGVSMSWTGVENVTVHGGGGKDTAELFDSAGDDTLMAAAFGGYGKLSGNGFANTVSGFSTISAFAENDGNDTAKMYDSAGDDLFVGKLGYAALSDGEGQMLLNNTYLIAAVSFDVAEVFASGGGGDRDIAKLYDSPEDDAFYATPVEAALYRGGSRTRVKFFEEVHVFATAGGDDSAKLYDSDGNDTFGADPEVAALWGEGFYNRAKFFESVQGNASDGGFDTATLVGSAGDDTFVGMATGGTLSGEGFANAAAWFEELDVTAENGGRDTAKLYDSPGDDTFELYPDRWTLGDDTHTVEGALFDTTHAYATGGGSDTALLYGSDGDDSFSAWGQQCFFSGDGFTYQAKYFEKVNVFGDGAAEPGDGEGGEGKAEDGEGDTAELYGTPDNDFVKVLPVVSTPELLSTQLYSGSGGYDYTVEDFENVSVNGMGGNLENAVLEDSSGDDQLWIHLKTDQEPSRVILDSEAGQLVEVKSFKEVEASAKYGGEDTVTFYGSAKNDTFDGTPKKATLTAAAGNSKTALYFEVVEVHAGPDGSTETGHDVATLSDSFREGMSDHNCAVSFLRTEDETSMDGFIPEGTGVSNESFDIRLTGFAEVYAEATKGEGEDEKDVAELFDSALDDLLEAADNWARLSYLDSESKVLSFCEISGFDPVRAFATTGTNKKDVDEESLTFEILYNGLWEEDA